jgi:hypothetical protein
MKRTFVWCAVALLSVMVAAQAQGNMGSGTEKAIAALEQQWVDSAKANNADALAPLRADKFVNTDSEGKVTGKEQARERPPRPAGRALATT